MKDIAPPPPTNEELINGLQAIADVVRPLLAVGLVEDGVPDHPETYELATQIFKIYAHTLNPSGYEDRH